MGLWLVAMQHSSINQFSSAHNLVVLSDSLEKIIKCKISALDWNIFFALSNLAVFLMIISYLHLLLSFVKSSVLQERAEEHCSVREVESLHNSSYNVELKDCFMLYTKEEKVGCLQMPQWNSETLLIWSP